MEKQKTVRTSAQYAGISLHAGARTKVRVLPAPCDTGIVFRRIDLPGKPEVRALASKVVEVQGRKLLDGGVSDSIPLAYFEQHGYRRNVVILTQPKGFVKERNKLMPLMRIGLRKYPRMIKALDERHLMYNRELEYVAQAEREGRSLVIRPDGKIPIGHISHDPDEMHHVYELGRQVGERYIERIKEFYNEN